MSLNYFLKHLSSYGSLLTNNTKNRELSLKGFSFIVMLFVMTSMQSQTTFTSVQSGDYTDPATWGTANAPTSDDHVIISSGNVVTLNDLLTARNVTIDGSLESTEASIEFVVTGNLTVTLGGLFKGIYFYTTTWGGYNKGIQLSVAGNITNNGRIDLSEGSSYDPEGVLNLNGTAVQTVTGLGTFGGTIYSTDNSNTGGVINQLIINNSSSATPNIVWGFDNVKIRSGITLTSAKIDLGTNKITIGNYGSATINCPAGNGFLSGTIGRWYGAYDTFAPLSPGSDYSNNNALFPFISADGKSRSAFITRPNDTTNSAVSGELSVSYFDASAVSNGFSIVDGTYTVTDIYEGAWSIDKDATYVFPLGNHSVAFSAEEAYLIKNGNSRIIKADGTTVGVHQTGTTTPFAQRIGLSDTDLSNAFLVGYNATLDTPVTSVQSGNWNAASTWSSNSVPSCSDTVTLLTGHTVTVNSVSSVAGVNINAGATLINDSSSLTVGCTNNNASFSNKGTFTINAGSLIVNGNVSHANGSTFNQIGGDIIVDGNNNGDAATSIDQTLFKIGNASLNLTGGKITIVDPPVVSASLVTSHTITSIVPCTGFFCWNPTDTYLDSIDDLAIGQVIVGSGIPAGTTITSINFDGSIDTSPSLPATGLSLPLTVSFYNVGNSVSAFVYDSSTNYAVGSGHTLQIGDGISTQKSTVTTNGYNCNFRAADGTLSLNNLIVDALDATNRFVNLDNNNANSSIVVMNVQNDFTITHGKVKGAGVDTYYGGNVVNNGELNMYNTTFFGNYIDGSYTATSNSQTISGTGTFNAQTDVALNTAANTGSVSQLKVNNTSTAGVTFTVPFNVVSGLVMTDGIIHTSATSLLKVGAPAMSYTSSVTGNFGANCYVDGPFAKDIGGGQNAIDLTNGSGFIDKFFFPVGKSSYAPIWVAITTPTGGFGSPGANIRAEAFETNAGTPSANIAHLNQNRWEVSKTAGTVIDFNIKVAVDAVVDDSYIIVQAPTAAGVYDNDFGITATYTTGTPNTLTSTSAPLPFSSFKGFFSTARQAECSAVTPGNTVASETAICGGKSVTLSLENVIIGEGISYQWQSSTNGSSYADITGAVSPTSSVAPLENTYYRCNVTCSFSTTTVASTPIQITLNNTIIATTPATICQPTDTATLLATSSSGDVKWYDAQTGGTTLGTGNSFTTPVITATTTFYAGTETTASGTAGLIYTNDGYGTGGTNKGLVFNLSNSIVLNSVKVYPQQNPGGTGPLPITVRVLQNGVQVPGTVDVTFTPDTFSDYSPTTTAQTVTLNYTLAAGNNYSLEVIDGITYDNALAYLSPFPSPFPVTNGSVSIVGGIDSGYVDTYSYYFFFDWDITEVCSSARVAVTATVQTALECGLGNPSVAESLANVVAYPNPFGDTFKLAIQTNITADVDVKVYDMLGRLLEHKVSSFDKISQMEIGSGYPSGVYNVVVTQDNKTKALHVIKR
ncbi:T9SS type A sorting domain-containing protein [Flavobacterium paronense]|uniref:T9SS type A sorting domain-containing protein n=1 Tax=Flavobacterium paronense TaxID=1392775 RepID=A0ABV5GHM9_9FLAO|nr:T9SS type A sorting domain-containing protein [Flavobacterium paronense]MDN3676391.1 T9SS type A sorting domain-containing protein [Flavobacterium paronense]